MANEVAPEGKVWVCGACGKRSRSNYGFDPVDSTIDITIDYGWDESCMMNAVLCEVEDLIFGEDGRVKGLKSLTRNSGMILG